MNITSLQVGPIGTNCYLLCDETAKVCAVVDPGGDADRIAAAVAKSGCTPSVILLTHGHYDHTNGVKGLLERFPGLPVYLNHRDVYPAGDPATQLFPVLPCPPRDYDEGDTVPVGTLTVSVLATPGHSEGSLVLQCGDVLFAGDTLFAGSCGRTDLMSGSMHKMMDSLRRLAGLKGNLAILPGHMEPTDLDCERATNAYLLQAMRGTSHAFDF